jgi:multicomponent Na+:H+ antiporter subunit B
VSEVQPIHRQRVGLLVVGAVATCLVAAIVSLPREDAPLPAVARQALEIALPQWHTTEPVNEIVYGTRGFDTFGETFLLLAAVVGVVVISRSKEHHRTVLLEDVLAREEQAVVDRRPAGAAANAGPSDPEEAEREEGAGVDEPQTPSPRDVRERADAGREPRARVGTQELERAPQMTIVVRGGLRVAAPVLAVAGLYLVAWGYAPGGGFPAGAVIAGVLLLAYVAYGYPAVRRFVDREMLENVEMAGAAAIIGLGLAGLAIEGSFSANFLPLGTVQTIRSGGVLQAFSAAELFEVATGLTLVIFALLSMGSDWVDEPEGDASGGGRP